MISTIIALIPTIISLLICLIFYRKFEPVYLRFFTWFLSFTVLIDVNMPVMDGIDTAKWLNQTYSSIKLAALSMNDTEKAIIRMIKAGCCAYLLKDTHPDEFEKALREIYSKGFYNVDGVNINYSRLLQSEKDLVTITEKGKKNLEYACSEMTYKEIAGLMNISERTVDGYRETLFHKFKVQTRVGLVLEVIRRDLVKL